MDYSVYEGNKIIGKVQVLRQGLYYRFICRCLKTGNGINRLWVCCGEKREKIGVLVPMGDGFGLDTKLPVKRIGDGEMKFFLGEKIDKHEGKFVPICPEEPFAYIERLKEAYLVKKNGQLGIVIRE